MIKDRNLTSHTYHEKFALKIYTNIKTYTPFLRLSLNNLLS
ncbi:nucleotidyltransferase substrate binding protein [Candidatus Babeliales bacterium]|nr:nucleotidyltransferase substrate binding protein [Candidatus Babeliales bacterium]